MKPILVKSQAEFNVLVQEVSMRNNVCFTFNTLEYEPIDWDVEYVLISFENGSENLIRLPHKEAFKRYKYLKNLK